MDPSPVAHSIVCVVDAASVFEATVSVMTVEDDVAATNVAVVLPTSTVQVGTFDVTKIAELAVMMIVSDTSAAPAVPVLRTPSDDGVNMNLCLMGAVPAESWLSDDAEPQTTGVAARVVYVTAPDVVVSVVVTVVKATAPAAGFTASAPLPVVHVNVVDAAAMAPVTVSTRTRSDVVAAATVPAVLEHVGTLPVM
jgi:hypothetical protein